MSAGLCILPANLTFRAGLTGCRNGVNVPSGFGTKGDWWMRGFRTRCLTSAVVIAGVMSVYAAPAAAHNNVGAAIAAGVLGLAVGAAVAADSGPRDHVIYGPPPPPFAPPPPGFDGPPPPPAYGPPPPPFFPERGLHAIRRSRPAIRMAGAFPRGGRHASMAIGKGMTMLSKNSIAAALGLAFALCGRSPRASPRHGRRKQQPFARRVGGRSRIRGQAV